LPESLAAVLGEHLERVKLTHQEDLNLGFGAVYLPGALDRKYRSAARARGKSGVITWTRQIETRMAHWPASRVAGRTLTPPAVGLLDQRFVEGFKTLVSRFH